MESKDYNKGIVKSFLKQHHPELYKELKTARELDEVTINRVERYLRQMD